MADAARRPPLPAAGSPPSSASARPGLPSPGPSVGPAPAPASPPEPGGGASPGAVDAAWRIHATVGEWTTRVDVKASVVLTLETALLAGLLTLHGDGGVFGPAHGLRLVLFLAGACCLFAGAVSAMLVVLPRMRGRHMPGETADNFVYFGHARAWDPARLARALHGDVLPVLTRDIVVGSSIAWRKHRLLQLSIALAVTGGLLLFLALVIPFPSVPVGLSGG